jgi:hypothetical protein
LNPGSPAPQASVLIQSRASGARTQGYSPEIPAQPDSLTRLRAHTKGILHEDRIINTLLQITKDILFVMQNLGHKKIETAMLYTQLETHNEDEGYTCKAASNVKEAADLIEHGFQCVTQIDEQNYSANAKLQQSISFIQKTFLAHEPSAHSPF